MAEEPEVPVEEPEVQAPAEEPEVQLPADRPAKNVLMEIQRRDKERQQQMTRIERQQEEMLNALRAIQTPRPATPAPVTGAEYSDEQLSQLASAGNPEALRILVQRQSQRDNQAQFTQFTQAQAVQAGLNEFFKLYPVLQTDQAHPLTQAVYAMRNRLIQSGRPMGPETDLAAITNTIASSPQLAVGATPQAPADTTRRAGVTAQQTMEGAASRRSPQSQQTAPVRPLDKRVQGIAKRMDVKDPQNSLKRFMDRQTSERSTVSPIIQQAVREEDLS